MGRCKAFLLDWDGTLIDSLPIKIANAEELFNNELAFAKADVRVSYTKHSGVPRRTLFDRIAFDCRGRNLTDAEFGPLSEAFTDLNTSRIASQGKLKPRTMSALISLKRSGRLLFVSTSAAPEEIMLLSEHFGIRSLCEGVFGSRPGFSKGSEHADHVRKICGLSVEELAGIGDDIEDIRLFNQAKILSIGLTGTRTRAELETLGADVVVDNLDEVAHVFA